MFIFSLIKNIPCKDKVPEIKNEDTIPDDDDDDMDDSLDDPEDMDDLEDDDLDEELEAKLDPYSFSDGEAEDSRGGSNPVLSRFPSLDKDSIKGEESSALSAATTAPAASAAAVNAVAAASASMAAAVANAAGVSAGVGASFSGSCTSLVDRYGTLLIFKMNTLENSGPKISTVKLFIRLPGIKIFFHFSWSKNGYFSTFYVI